MAANTPDSKGRRTFIAVPLPPAVRTALFTACGSLGTHLPAVRWLRKVENFHVTLRFLGNVGDDQLQELGDALAPQLAQLPRFAVEMVGLSAFPTANRAKVIWAGIADRTGGLARVAGVVGAATAHLGPLEPEARPFRAHVTLGRSKAAVDARAALASLSDHTFGQFTVDEVHVYESSLGPNGSTYVLRNRATLG